MYETLYNFLKRLFDICSSALALVVTSPLWLLCLIGIKLSSRGPVFYVSHRVCRRNRPFKMYKFRSMHVFQPQHEGQCSEGSFVEHTRVFWFGSFMRQSKLDELPQLLNVLRGEMSIVGPRPVSQASAEKNYMGEYACIPDVKPGLACLDSLFDYTHGELVVKNDEIYKAEVIPVRRELARIYVKRRGVAMDLYCILRTLLLIFQIAVLGKRDFSYTKIETDARAQCHVV